MDQLFRVGKASTLHHKAKAMGTVPGHGHPIGALYDRHYSLYRDTTGLAKFLQKSIQVHIGQQRHSS